MNKIRALANEARMLVRKLEEAADLLDRLTNSVDELSALTDREREIAGLLKEGLERKEIASRLSLSDKTIDTNRENIRKKLKFATSKELVEYLKKIAI